MDQGRIDELMASLKPYPYGWTAEIPEDCGSLFGQTVTLEFETQPTPKADPAPAVNEQEQKLACTVLSDFKNVLATVASQFREYTSDNLDEKKAARTPHVWISRDNMEQEGPTRWAFVIGREDAPDYGVHVEFAGLEYLETWGGD